MDDYMSKHTRSESTVPGMMGAQVLPIGTPRSYEASFWEAQ